MIHYHDFALAPANSWIVRLHVGGDHKNLVSASRQKGMIVMPEYNTRLDRGKIQP